MIRPSIRFRQHEHVLQADMADIQDPFQKTRSICERMFQRACEALASITR
jgi:hypothetical protein